MGQQSFSCEWYSKGFGSLTADEEADQETRAIQEYAGHLLNSIFGLSVTSEFDTLVQHPARGASAGNVSGVRCGRC